MQSDQFKKDQHRAFNKLRIYMDFNNANILEIGGNSTLESTEPFVYHGAKVTVTGVGHIDGDFIHESGVRVFSADARNLKSFFLPEQFEVVYGLAVIEHICNPEKFLSDVVYLLKPGGFAYFDGSPFWTSDIGHHLWIMSWKYSLPVNYSFTATKEEWLNPIPPWGHLYMGENELRKYLVDQGKIPKEHAELILDEVYHSSDINRLSAYEIAETYSRCGLVVREANMMYAVPPDSIMELLRAKFEHDPGFSIRGGAYVLQKPFKNSA